MKKYSVIQKNSGYEKEVQQFNFWFKFLAIRKARKLSNAINKQFHSQSRVFIKEGDNWFNPDKKYSEYFGMSWAIE